MTAEDPRSSSRIRDLNDAFRRTFVGGTVVITAGVEALPSNKRRSILAKVRAFDAFTEDNDPREEHDFGVVEHRGVRCFLKIDYYDRGMEMLSSDPADPVRHHPRPDVWRSSWIWIERPPPAAARRQITPQPDRRT